MSIDPIIDDIIGGAADVDALETCFMPPAVAHRRRPRRRMDRLDQQQALTDVIRTLPEPGESVHIVSAAKFDFWTWVPAMLEWIGRTEALYASTWTLSRTNAVELFELWDAGKIGTASFLTGTYFKRRETAVYSYLLEGIRARGGRYRAFANHAKVMLLGGSGAWLVIEGSANLTANPRLEQYVLSNDRALWEFHRGWMESVYAARARPATRTPTTAGPARRGFSHKRAGLGVMAYSNHPGERRGLIGWKLAPVEDVEATRRYAEAIVELIREWAPVLPSPAVVTVPPQGASYPGAYYAAALAREVARLLGVPFRHTLERHEQKQWHGPLHALQQGTFTATVEAGTTYIVVDDLITSGATMRRSLEALRAAGVPAFGFAYNGS